MEAQEEAEAHVLRASSLSHQSDEYLLSLVVVVVVGGLLMNEARKERVHNYIFHVSLSSMGWDVIIVSGELQSSSMILNCIR